MSKKTEKIFWTIFILIVGLIFISSSMTYKQQTMVPTFSKYLTGKPFNDFLSQFHFQYDGTEESIKNVGYYKFVEFIIRKAAHFFSYFAIGGALWIASYNRVQPKFLAAIFAWLSTTGLAALDEFHQQLTGGRTPLVTDVMIDSVGALTGIIIIMIITYIIKKHKKII